MWKNRTVWITGASSGIGRGLAADLARRGATIGLLARRTGELEALAGELRDLGSRVAWQGVDVSDEAAVDEALSELARVTGPCDMLIANAGIYRQTPGETLDRDTCREVIETNLMGVIHCISAVVSGMVERQSGHLVAVSSLAARIGLPEGAAYCASKAAVALFCESLRIDLRPRGVLVTTIFPGHVDTPMITDSERDAAVPLARAVRQIRRAVERERAEHEFPRGTSALIRLAKWLPIRLRDQLVLKFEAMPEAAREET